MWGEKYGQRPLNKEKERVEETFRIGNPNVAIGIKNGWGWGHGGEERRRTKYSARRKEKKIKRENFSSSPPTVSLRALPIYRYRRFFGKWFLCVCVWRSAFVGGRFHRQFLESERRTLVYEPAFCLLLARSVYIVRLSLLKRFVRVRSSLHLSRQVCCALEQHRRTAGNWCEFQISHLSADRVRPALFLPNTVTEH